MDTYIKQNRPVMTLKWHKDTRDRLGPYKQSSGTFFPGNRGERRKKKIRVAHNDPRYK